MASGLQKNIWKSTVPGPEKRRKCPGHDKISRAHTSMFVVLTWHSGLQMATYLLLSRNMYYFG